MYDPDDRWDCGEDSRDDERAWRYVEPDVRRIEDSRYVANAYLAMED